MTRFAARFSGTAKRRPNNEPLRIWIAELFTGGGILYGYLPEEFLINNSLFNIQLFGSDISEQAIIESGREYMKNEVNGLSEKDWNNFFSHVDGDYRLNKSIRDCCVFANHNFLKDPPFAKIDLISCRNALIYLEPQLQKNVLTAFHYALKRKGFLLLGKSETASQSRRIIIFR